MYYRIAIQVDASPAWQWKSAPLISLNTLLHWLHYYRALPYDRLRIFSSASRELLNEQLVRENQGLMSTSVPVIQFLQERRISIPGRLREASSGGTQANGQMASTAVFPEPLLGESGREAAMPDEGSMNFLERRRVELEHGTGGDHDLPYQFALPISMPQFLAWVKLLVRVRQGEIQL